MFLSTSLNGVQGTGVIPAVLDILLGSEESSTTPQPPQNPSPNKPKPCHRCHKTQNPPSQPPQSAAPPNSYNDRKTTAIAQANAVVNSD